MVDIYTSKVEIRTKVRFLPWRPHVHSIPASRHRSRSAHDRRARLAHRVRRGWRTTEAVATRQEPHGLDRGGPPRPRRRHPGHRGRLHRRRPASRSSWWRSPRTSSTRSSPRTRRPAKLPDVIGGLPLGQVRTLSANELIDTDAVGAVVDDLDRGTFNESALELTADGDDQLAVPERVVGAAAGLPQGPLRQGRAGTPRRRTTTCWRPRRRSTPRTWPASSAPTSRVTPSPSRPSRRSAWATTASSSTTAARSPSTAPQCVGGARLLRPAAAELLGGRRPGRRHHAGGVLRRQGARC